ncbi:hypothetical protein LUZ60_012763 [Juncus effusus]|nr:hypothetical protein LUZ60_012763 [Juncus effusus]
MHSNLSSFTFRIKESLMEIFESPLLHPLFVLLIFLSIFEQPLALTCAPSSCGQLREIRHPFHLQTDPPSCGSRNYELLCKENKTFVQILTKDYYYVINISYMNKTITVVDPAFISGDCTLPSLITLFEYDSFGGLYYSSPNGEYFIYSSPYGEYSYSRRFNYTAFMRCTTRVQQKDYWHVPCLSKNGTYVYAFTGPYPNRVLSLRPSCGPLGVSPFGGDTTLVNSSKDVFQILQKGFVLHWGNHPSKLSLMLLCIQQSARIFFNETNGSKNLRSLVLVALLNNGLNFVECLHEIFNLNIFSSYCLLVLVEFLQLIILLCLLGRFLFVPFSILFFIIHKFWLERISIDSIDKFLQDQQRLIAPKRYAYTDIIALTGHFREKLGQGGFGTVFRATLLSKQQVAIKMLGNSISNGDEFINEVSTLGRIHHLNVVQLLGYCSDGSKRALVYEYMPNGSLDKYIFSRNGITRRVFTWAKLNQIALGVAHGIDYLHRGCEMQILHFDIKPHNILLDNNFNPKISDFGLAKLYPRDHSLVSLSAARGTIGYMAPELVSRSFGVISYKSDVYSFGMLLLEMAGGRRNADPRVENPSQVYYPSWIYDKLKEQGGLEISATYQINTIERKLCMVGLWCIQMKSTDRPPMSRVVEMLEGDADSLEMPPPPFFSSSGSNPPDPLHPPLKLPPQQVKTLTKAHATTTQANANSQNPAYWSDTAIRHLTLLPTPLFFPSKEWTPLSNYITLSTLEKRLKGQQVFD